MRKGAVENHNAQNALLGCWSHVFAIGHSLGQLGEARLGTVHLVLVNDIGLCRLVESRSVNAGSLRQSVIVAVLGCSENLLAKGLDAAGYDGVARGTGLDAADVLD